MKQILLILLAVNLTAISNAQSILDKAKKTFSKNPGVTEEEAGFGVKEALNNGINSAVSFLNKPDAFFKSELYKVLLPPDAKKMEKTLRDIGMGKMADDAIEAINRGAEDAVGYATPIFVDAIKQMTVTDALKLVTGGKNSITEFFREKTSAKLKAAFMPVIEKSLEKTNATKYYGDAVNRYNKVPFAKKMNPDLSDYVADRTLFALFDRIGVEEANIRSNPAARTSDLLKKVFGGK
jgi:Nitrate reductase alpha subunit